jgi:F-type H+-transporting ATPase subunit b
MLSVSLGTVIWTTIAFLVVVFLLAKFAWKPILNSIREREESISQALEDADKAKELMRELKEDNEKLLQEARMERDEILKSAREAKEKMISEAKDKAKEEGEKMIANAKESIRSEKAGAMNELKTYVAELSLDIAEKIIREKLQNEGKQKEIIESTLKDAKLN